MSRYNVIHKICPPSFSILENISFMTRQAQIRIKKQSIIQRYTPDSWHDYLDHRLTDFRAVAMFCFGAFLLISLSSYHSEDASMNTSAQSDVIHNWMGSSGAITSDLLIQFFGIGSYVFVKISALSGCGHWRSSHPRYY